MIPTDSMKPPTISESGQHEQQQTLQMKVNSMNHGHHSVQGEFAKLDISPPPADEEAASDSSDATHVSEDGECNELATNYDSTITLTNKNATQVADEVSDRISTLVPAKKGSKKTSGTFPTRANSILSTDNTSARGSDISSLKALPQAPMSEPLASIYSGSDVDGRFPQESFRSKEPEIVRPPRVLRPKVSSGLDSVSDQRRKIVNREGSVFSLMVAGESGLGKTTFVNTLFGDQLMDPNRQNVSPSNKQEGGNPMKTTTIEVHEAVYEDINGFSVNYSVIDTPGFGDYINNEFACVPIRDYIDLQHRMYMLSDEQPVRQDKKDTRVHACLYFLRPSGRGLVELDIQVMQELSSRVNLIPVIAKADSFTPDELNYNKRIIRDAIIEHNIQVYCPQDDTLGKTTMLYKDILEKQNMPFSVICSEQVTQAVEKKVKVAGIKQSLTVPIRGRVYEGGIAEVDNAKHCDFQRLVGVLMKESMLHLIDTTETQHYEKYRRETIQLRIDMIRGMLERENVEEKVSMAVSTSTQAVLPSPSGNLSAITGAVSTEDIKVDVKTENTMLLDPGFSFEERHEICARIRECGFYDKIMSKTSEWSGFEVLELMQRLGIKPLERLLVSKDPILTSRQRRIATAMKASCELINGRFTKWAGELLQLQIGLDSELEAYRQEIKFLQSQNNELDPNGGSVQQQIDGAPHQGRMKKSWRGAA